jgi:hypothetical protein
VGDDKQAWTKATYGEVRATLGFLSPMAAEIVTAHAAYESGFGGTEAAVRGRNLTNITAGSAWTGPKWLHQHGDKDEKGNPIDQWWRIYPTVRDFLVDYWAFLGPAQNHGAYTVARNYLERGRAGDFAISLRVGGYYKLDPVRYSREMREKLDVVHLYLTPPGAA